MHTICELEISKYSCPQINSRPSFALKAGHELRRCDKLIRNVALKHHDSAMLQRANEYLEVRAYEWRAIVSGAAQSSLSRKKQNRPDLLPCRD